MLFKHNGWHSLDFLKSVNSQELGARKMLETYELILELLALPDWDKTS